MSSRVSSKFSVFLLVFFLFTALAPLPLRGVELPLKAESAILMDAHSGKILYEKESHKILYPASMTKLMTLVLAMEALEIGKIKMNDVITVSENAASYRGSHIYLAPGEKLTLRELLLGIALASGNDASVAVAEYIAGTHEAFVDLMNKKAAELGMKNTHFVNCNGLHNSEHYSTAYDFSLLARAALCFPDLLEICSVKHYRIRTETKRPFQYDNKNKLLWFYSGTDGFKTGWTEDAKYCFVGTCYRDGLRLISVVMGVPVPRGHFSETQILFNYGFSQFSFQEFYKEKEIVGEVKVGKGKTNKVPVVPEKRVGIILSRGEGKDLNTEIELVPLVNAPVKKGEVVGHISIVKDGEILARTNLLSKDDVVKGSFWQMVKKVFRGVATK
ncbi:MAG: D-alanyl-D-alanine carboxypeptidase [Clostridia bacterium]|nr:D-alanyl-D-alanine carboxypeptidase [Clostridia bacterium]MDD4665855.1 D-alanyl-D-alanine carboxypeptidase [Clostridia bacterium]